MIATTRKGIGGHTSSHRGASDIWLTPPEILRALGSFDLDPCPAPEPRPWETASTYFGVGEGHLPWEGRVWLNPPYGPELGTWLWRLSRHGNGIAIVFARTETQAFFEYVWPKASALLFIKGRLHFCNAKGERAKGNAGGPSVLIAYGESNAIILRDCGIPGAFVPLTPADSRVGEKAGAAHA